MRDVERIFCASELDLVGLKGQCPEIFGPFYGEKSPITTNINVFGKFSFLWRYSWKNVFPRSLSFENINFKRVDFRLFSFIIHANCMVHNLLRYLFRVKNKLATSVILDTWVNTLKKLCRSLLKSGTAPNLWQPDFRASETDFTVVYMERVQKILKYKIIKQSFR